MSKAKPTAEAVIDESAIARREPLLPKWNPPENPSWQRARDLYATAGKGAEAIIMMGMEISALKKQYISQGSRNSSEIGWQAMVEKELGICFKTAYRIMERAQYSCMILSAATSDEPIIYTDSRKIDITVEPTPEIRKLAADKLEDLAAGTISPKRAWAGIVGEGSRRDKQGGSASRAGVDHYRNIDRAIKSLRYSFNQWQDLEPRQRADIEEKWHELTKSLPSVLQF
jgi:hypothetical protein